MELFFATSNPGKLREAQAILSAHTIRQLPVGYDEIRSDSTDDVALDGVRQVVSKTGKPCFVEDSGLFVDALKGFPGTYSAFAFKRIGYEGILKLLTGEKKRGAKFISSVAYQEPASEPRVFRGEVEGFISETPRGTGGFGYDPIFIPKGYKKTFAELETKDKISHRYLALKQLEEHL
ncbi:MAG: RdgB/HAM1 family non-canonical purine NTP pyrophosphatase [archaeon]